MRKNLWNTKDGRRLADITLTVYDYAFNNILKFDENGNMIKIEANGPEWIELVTTVKSGLEKAKNMIKDRSTSLNQKINKLWFKLQELSNEELVVLNALVEYKINMSYYGSQCHINWYDLTDATFSNSPRINSKWGKQRKDGYAWIDYTTNPFAL